MLSRVLVGHNTLPSPRFEMVFMSALKLYSGLTGRSTWRPKLACFGGVLLTGNRWFDDPLDGRDKG